MRQHGWHEVCRDAARLMHAGEMACSPFAHSHCIACFGLPGDWGSWGGRSRAMLARCDRLAVQDLDGWQESVGVRREIGTAQAMGIPARHVVPEANPPAGAGG